MIPQSILDEKSLIKSADLRVIFETFYGLGIDDFSSITANNPREVEEIINKDGVMNLFESDLVKFVLSVATQGPAVRSAVAQYVNNQLSIYGYDAVVSDDEFQLPTYLRDENGFIKTEDISILLDTFYG